MADYTSVPIQDSEKARLLAADGEPACDMSAPPPDYESRQASQCPWSRRAWCRRWGRPWWRHHHDVEDQFDANRPPNAARRRHCFVRFLFRLIALWIIVHVIVHAVHHAHRYLNHHDHHGHHGHHDHRHHGHHGHHGQEDDWEAWGHAALSMDSFEEPGFMDDGVDTIHSAYPVPPYPLDEDVDDNEDVLFNQLEEVFEHHQRPSRPPRRPSSPPACNPEDLEFWDGPAKFAFNPDDYGVLAFKHAGGSDHGKVFIHQSADVDEVSVNLSILAAGEKYTEEIEVVVKEDTDHGVFALSVRTPHRVGPNCIKVSADITLPDGLESFKTFVRASNGDIKIESVSGIKFAWAAFHTLNGSIKFDDVRVAKGKFTTVRGNVKGSLSVSEKAYFATVKGLIEADVEPEESGEEIDIKARVVAGHVDLRVPGESYSGPFKVAAFKGKVGVEAEDDDSLVIERSKYNAVEGYYKEKDTGSVILVQGIRALLNLTFT